MRGNCTLWARLLAQRNSCTAQLNADEAPLIKDTGRQTALVKHCIHCEACAHHNAVLSSVTRTRRQVYCHNIPSPTPLGQGVF